MATVLPEVHAASATRRRAGMFAILRHPSALWHLLTDRGAPWLPRIVALCALAYVVMPFDAIPDVIPIVGWLDDLGAVTFALGYVASRAARYESERSPAG